MQTTQATEPIVAPEACQESRCQQDFTLFVHLIDGSIRSVAPATAVRLTNTEVVLVFGELVVASFPRSEVFFVTREEAAPPCWL